MTDAECEAQIRLTYRRAQGDMPPFGAVLTLLRLLDEARAERDDAYRRCQESNEEIVEQQTEITELANKVGPVTERNGELRGKVRVLEAEIAEDKRYIALLLERAKRAEDEVAHRDKRIAELHRENRIYAEGRAAGVIEGSTVSKAEADRLQEFLNSLDIDKIERDARAQAIEEAAREIERLPGMFRTETLAAQVRALCRNDE